MNKIIYLFIKFEYWKVNIFTIIMKKVKTFKILVFLPSNLIDTFISYKLYRLFLFRNFSLKCYRGLRRDLVFLEKY